MIQKVLNYKYSMSYSNNKTLQSFYLGKNINLSSAKFEI